VKKKKHLIFQNALLVCKLQFSKIHFLSFKLNGIPHNSIQIPTNELKCVLNFAQPWKAHNSVHFLNIGTEEPRDIKICGYKYGHVQLTYISPS